MVTPTVAPGQIDVVAGDTASDVFGTGLTVTDRTDVHDGKNPT